ncbi:Alpha-glucosidase [Pseudozyma hubeiensis]|nr:Alpha-glucosidase [Pseudozyma hubeiensis]
MAITLQTVLPQKVLPRAPSPNSSSPNPGVRSSITQFIPASPDASLDRGSRPAHTPSDSTDSAFARGKEAASSSSTQGRVDAGETLAPLRSPGLGPSAPRKSMSAGAGSRRGIAHSSRILGVDKKTQETFALSQLTNGKIDVSFEGTLAGRQPPSPSGSNHKGKGKARNDGDDDKSGQNGHPTLFDVDLETGQQTVPSSSTASRAGRLLQLGSNSMPWKKPKSNVVPAYQGEESESAGAGLTSTRNNSLDFDRSLKLQSDTKAGYAADPDGDGDDDRTGFGAFDDDREQLLYAGADDDASRPGYFAPGDRGYGYNSLQDGAGQGGYGSAVGFEAVTWSEGGWMVVSSVFVAVLMVVAILISIDVIDWPGDGIGKN